MRLQGVGVGRGVVTGPVLRMPEPLPEPSDSPRTVSADEEYERAAAALRATALDLTERADRLGGEGKDVLEAQALMAQDPTLLEDVRARIDASKTAERAVFEAFNTFQQMLLSMGGYMAERASDLGDLSQRAIAHVRGVPMPEVPQVDYPFILVARDLAVADTADLDLTKVLGLITAGGGPTSHTAILARSKSIVAVVGVAGAADLDDGVRVLVDAGEGVVTTNPSEKAIEAAQRRLNRRRLKVPIGPGCLADDVAIPLLANLERVEDAERARELGAEGVGLFRTEFLFLGSEVAPSRERQHEHYARLLRAFPGQKVVVRTLDAGADKPLPFLRGGPETNPALGLRGIRAMRDNEQILRDQLAALALAAAESSAELWVMAPMIADAAETAYFVTLAREYDLPVAGVMAEVPSSALLAAQILGIADFVSIGTNDLTQYTLAADRLLGTVAHYQDPWHPAVLRLIKMLGDAGAQSGRSVGVCGEAAADPLLAVILVGLGVTSLSMTPEAMADVRTELRQHTLEHARALAVRALAASTAGEARAVMLES
ncbi:phosphoenolpyruvate--protein phosphotransferase [Mycetocola spongiae]|uniref:phosphoenolpyruvate--protein phosphotransferase n=1 Tax=Mycetocola spongiae TaxID=2859226 RepID=UPI001CF2EA96|nr:phosphoenolpyruvate--protein phosphotransferase [Mycetocola spongiae]UCR90408.1 phosphoenolpyruvate--protein phosphotransferase [Mycetocola spongiae]